MSTEVGASDDMLPGNVQRKTDFLIPCYFCFWQYDTSNTCFAERPEFLSRLDGQRKQDSTMGSVEAPTVMWHSLM